MKLIQYRLIEGEKDIYETIGISIMTFFSTVNDTKLIGIYSKLDEKKISTSELNFQFLSGIISNTLVKSFDNFVNYDTLGSIKSSISCRFVAFEDDGLMRICYGTEDSVINFEKFCTEFSDVSNLLIQTDMFDFC